MMNYALSRVDLRAHENVFSSFKYDIATMERLPLHSGMWYILIDKGTTVSALCNSTSTIFYEKKRRHIISVQKHAAESIYY